MIVLSRTFALLVRNKGNNKIEIVGRSTSKNKKTVIHFEALVEIAKIYSITNRRF
jgi:hypothetical protein